MVEPGIIGRQRELDEIAELLAHTRRGDGKLHLVAGEPGIGKSTLVEAAIASARDAGYAAAWGRAWEAGGAPAYWPWTQVVRAIKRERPEVAVPSELVWMLGTSSLQRVADDRFAMFDAMLQFLVAAAAQPLVLVFEDLHATDHASLVLLAFVAAHLSGVPLAIVGTHRTREAHMTPEVAEALERVGRVARRAILGRLTRDDIAALAGDRTDAIVEAAFRASEGNPLFATEILRVINEQADPSTLVVPYTVRAAIREHLRHLAPAERDLAAVAAVIGREHALTQVGELADLPEREADALLRRLVERGVLVEIAPRAFRFAHALIAETLLFDLDPARRELLHGRLADLLERTDAAAEILIEITRHRFEAGEQARPAAVAVARRAAAAALGVFAFEEAVDLLARALTAIPADDQGQRSDVMLELATAQFLAERVEAGRATSRQVAEIARTLGSPDLFARAALTYGKALTAGFVDPTLVELLEEALRIVPTGDSSQRAQLLARLASALQPTDDPEPPMQIARDAIAMARRLGDERTLLAVLHSALSAMTNFAPGTELVPMIEESMRLARKYDEPAIALRGRYRLVVNLLDAGQLDAAAAIVREYADASVNYRNDRMKFEGALMRGLMAIHRGTRAEYDACVTEARVLRNTARGLETMRASVAWQLDMFELRARNHLEGLFSLDVFVAGHSSGKIQRLYHLTSIPYAYARVGQRERAMAAWARLSLDDLIRYQDQCMLAFAASTAITLDDREGAEQLYQAMLPREGRWAMSGLPALALEGPISAYLFLLADYLNLPTAAAHGETMLRELRGAGATLLLERFSADYERFRAKANAPARETKSVVGVNNLAAPASLTLDGDVWVVRLGPESCRVRASLGLEYLAKLVASPATEIHALDLAGAQNVDAGDAGEVLDREALAAYRKRVLAIRSALEDELADDRREQLETELEHLDAQIRAGAGLGGRVRRTGGSAERARINVRRRIADAIARVAELAPAIGRHLDASLRTGMQCSYDPRRSGPRA